MSFRLGFDIGGTFTDIALIDDDTGDVHRMKVPTTPDDFSVGAVDAISRLCEANEVDYGEVSHVSHGTTVATNALIEREGVTTGLLTTEGFRDVLAIGREKRTEIYDLSPVKTPTFAARRHRRGIPERVSADGEVLEPLDEEAVIESIRDLESAGVESVAVSLLHAYRFRDHELRVAKLVREHSGMSVTISSNVMSELNEYERTLSTTIDAYVGPLISVYLDRLTERLAELGVEETLHLMQANGGVITPETIAGRRLRLVNSGPAAGVLGAKQLAAAAGHDDIITLDMGGTSTDTSVLSDGTVATSTTGEIEDIPLLFPQIDVRSIGTGGGSIARVDKMGVLKVGPRSAGAEPGPACYGRGGTEPSVTDAALQLGYLNPTNFLGGRMSLDAEAAERALAGPAEALGISVTELAAGVHEVVATNMVGGIRKVTVEKGYDPRGFALVCYGGAGPLFGDVLAGKLDLDRVLIPPSSGILSAYGLVTADRRFDVSRSRPLVVEVDNLPAMNEVLEKLSERTAGVGDDPELYWSVDLRYLGQTFDLNVPLPAGELDEGALSTLIDRFGERYRAVYGVVNEDEPVEAVTWRLEAIDPVADVVPTVTGGDLETAHKGTRRAYDGDGFVDFDVYDRVDLPVDRAIDGPAIIEEAESTTVVLPETRCHVDGTGNLILDRDG